MTMSRNSIFALATPFAKSGVAIVRVSGPQAKSALAQLTGDIGWAPNLARYATLRAPDGHIIDKCPALFFENPKSFTGEDVVEFHIHGSLSVIRELLDILAAMDGLRPAEPGEFTRRAFLNGKMDLLEAEGLADLIDAETPAQKTQAFSQMQGNMSRYYDDLRTHMVQCLALLEAYIDFPDEEIPDSVLTDLSIRIVELQKTIKNALADGKKGEKLREGVHIAIIGAPNVGKSTLLNLITRKNAAITSPKAGTTRDIIEVSVTISGFPVIFSDTAGLRETDDEIEKEGVRRALARAGEAEITLVVLDATKLDNTDNFIEKQATDKSIFVINKCDISSKPHHDNSAVLISAKTGQGVDDLLDILDKRISGIFSSSLPPVITRIRHRALLEDALHYLERFSPDKPIELACEELRSASLAVGRITGKIQVDDVLDVVFRQFCIGK